MKLFFIIYNVLHLYYLSVSMFCCCSALICVSKGKVLQLWGQRGHSINRSGLRELSILDTLKNWYIPTSS